jgi:ArsR family transcriptional regulator, arsenate/arsenite/antimonite-responsive transcriptional repressor
MKNIAELFKIFCVGKRIDIIEHLKNGSMCVNSLANSLKVSPSAVSQHLRILKSAGLVKDERKGYFIHYSLNKDALEKARRCLTRVCSCGCIARIRKRQ